MRLTPLGVALVVATFVTDGARAQSSPQASPPTFEVASIKSNQSTTAPSLFPAPGRLVATNVALRLLVQWAYRRADGRIFRDEQVIGGPRWMDTEHFDVQAKTTTEVPIDQMELMAQALLESRFQLKTHRETREVPVYALVRVKGGAKLKPSEDQTPLQDNGQRRIFNPSAPQRRGTIIRMSSSPSEANTRLSGVAAPMAMLVNALQGYVDRVVIDATDLKGLFDLRLEFNQPASANLNAAASPESPLPQEAAAGALLFTAIQEQLGLKLEPTKGPVEVLVIDRAEHPTTD
jgi:uncharacterized protein (TIGR03435 family)